MHHHILRLSNPERPVRGLVFHSRIPPAVKMDHMVCLCQIQPGSPGFYGKNNKGHVLFSLKCFHDLAALSDRGPSVEHKSLCLEDLCQKCRQVFRDLLELRKHKHTFAFFVNGCADFLQHGELPAFLHGKCLLPQILVGMVADLLQPDDRSHDQSSALDSVRFLQPFLQI